MLSAQELDVLKNVGSVLGNSTEFIITQYTSWVMTSAVGLVILGVLICLSVLKLKFSERSEVELWCQNLLKGAIIFVGCLFILGNIPDVVSPKAAAIHQLLKDVTTIHKS